MKKKPWLWVVLASCLSGCTCLALCLAAVFFAPKLGELQLEESVQPGMPAPDFNLPGLAGGEVQLSKYAGTPVLLTIGTTW